MSIVEAEQSRKGAGQRLAAQAGIDPKDVHADLGVAMGAMGTDVAIESADVALMGEDLCHLPQVLACARRSRAIMWQSVGLSLAIIITLVPLALFGVLGLAAVVLVHEVAEVVVIGNGIRAGRTHRLGLSSTSSVREPQPLVV